MPLVVLNCRQYASFGQMETNQRYEYISLIRRVRLIEDLHHATVLLSKKAISFLQDIVRVYRTAAAVHENNILQFRHMLGTRRCSLGIRDCPFLLNEVLTQ